MRRKAQHPRIERDLLHAIIYRVLGLVDLGNLYASKEEKRRGKNDVEQDRVMDFLVHEMREHVIRALPSMIEGIVEVKRCPKRTTSKLFARRIK